MKARILFKDVNGEKCSTTATVVWAHNHLLQHRQFASDGVRTFYQPDTRSLFQIVNERDLPENARQALAAG